MLIPIKCCYEEESNPKWLVELALKLELLKILDTLKWTAVVSTGVVSSLMGNWPMMEGLVIVFWNVLFSSDRLVS